MEIQAIATVLDSDVAQAISEMPDYEISDLFIQVINKLDNPVVIRTIANRILTRCNLRYGD